MSAADIVNQRPGLTEAQRRRALEIGARIEALQAELEKLLSQPENPPAGIELHDRGISETQAADLRARLKTFAEDWNRPEAAIYDEAPPR